jgi:hypothetical protein
MSSDSLRTAPISPHLASACPESRMFSPKMSTDALSPSEPSLRTVSSVTPLIEAGDVACRSAVCELSQRPDRQHDVFKPIAGREPKRRATEASPDPRQLLLPSSPPCRDASSHERGFPSTRRSRSGGRGCSSRSVAARLCVPLKPAQIRGAHRSEWSKLPPPRCRRASAGRCW